ncbi:MAG: HAMP domain-containing sensor histidine kinase [Phormidesmis sp.]
MSVDTSSMDSNENLRLAYQRLLALERFKSGFLARTSHELRSPINTIVSLHQLILEDLCEGPEEEKEFIEQSKGAALKMLALFDQIAAVSKLDVGREPPKLAAADLSFLLPEVEMLTVLQAKNQNVRYTVDILTDELEVYTDAKWLKNILASLIQDAIPHTKVLRLTTVKSSQSVAVVIEGDRPAATLQSELDNISESAANASETPSSEASETDSLQSARNFSAEDIKLSTGLILATAQTALPLIGGEFLIAPRANSNKGSCLQCIFPLLQPS